MLGLCKEKKNMILEECFNLGNKLMFPTQVHKINFKAI